MCDIPANWHGLLFNVRLTCSVFLKPQHQSERMPSMRMFASWMALPCFFSWGFGTVLRQWSKDYAHRQRYSEGCKDWWSQVLEIQQLISNIMHTCLWGMTPKHTILSIVEGVVRPEVDETRAVLVLPLPTSHTHVASECIPGTKVLNFEFT